MVKSWNDERVSCGSSEHSLSFPNRRRLCGETPGDLRYSLFLQNKASLYCLLGAGGLCSPPWRVDRPTSSRRDLVVSGQVTKKEAHSVEKEETLSEFVFGYISAQVYIARVFLGDGVQPPLSTLRPVSCALQRVGSLSSDSRETRAVDARRRLTRSKYSATRRSPRGGVVWLVVFKPRFPSGVCLGEWFPGRSRRATRQLSFFF